MESYAGITGIFFSPSFSGLALALHQKNLPVNMRTGKHWSIQENDIIWNVKMNKELHVCNKAELTAFFFLVEKVSLLI